MEKNQVNDNFLSEISGGTNGNKENFTITYKCIDCGKIYTRKAGETAPNSIKCDCGGVAFTV